MRVYRPAGGHVAQWHGWLALQGSSDVWATVVPRNGVRTAAHSCDPLGCEWHVSGLFLAFCHVVSETSDLTPCECMAFESLLIFIGPVRSSVVNGSGERWERAAQQEPRLSTQRDI